MRTGIGRKEVERSSIVSQVIKDRRTDKICEEIVYRLPKKEISHRRKDGVAYGVGIGKELRHTVEW